MTRSESRLNLIPISKDNNGPLQYQVDIEKSIQLPGAHGEELIRDIFTDVQVSHVTVPKLP